MIPLSPQAKQRSVANRIGHWLLGASIIGCLFVYLMQPMGYYAEPSDATESASELQSPDLLSVSRMQFFLASLTYPTEILNAWTASGELPLGLSDRLSYWVAACLYFGCCWGIGYFLLPSLGVSQHLRAQGHMHAVATVLGSYFVMLGLTWWHSVSTTWFAFVALAVGFSCWFWFKHKTQNVSLDFADEEKPKRVDTNQLQIETSTERKIAVVSAAGIIVLGLFSVASASLPSGDESLRSEQLLVLREYVESDSISHLPHNVASAIPLGGFAPAFLPRVLGLSSIWDVESRQSCLFAVVISASHLLLAVWLVVSYCARHQNIAVAYFAGFACISAPTVFEHAITGFPECVALPGLLTLVALRDSIWSRIRTRGLLLAILAGGILNASMLVAIPLGLVIGTCLLVTRNRSGGQSRAVLWTLAAFGAGGGLASSWYIRNAVEFGSPFFPLGMSFFPSQNDANASGVVSQWSGVSLAQALWTHDLASPLACIGCIVWICKRQYRQRGELAAFGGARILMLGSVCGLLPLAIAMGWGVSTELFQRVMLFLWPVVCLVSTIGLKEVRARCGAAFTLGLVGFSVLFSFSTLLHWPYIDSRVLVAQDALDAELTNAVKESNGQQFQRPHPLRRNPIYVPWMNENLNRDQHRVVVIGNSVLFDLLIPFRYSHLLEADSQSAFFDEVFRQPAGVTHLLIDWEGLDPAERPACRELLRAARKSQQVARVDVIFDGIDAELFEWTGIGEDQSESL